ncbi:phage tail assembly chaperone family protein, TAC [Comamonas kerstersii]|uniref:phage tail assembly chaperone family protein, TAC n=1 Tax=Comamonas kerstersii TaxID=225992 RepID=UPI001B34206D|nr:phage tail assembly chaperone family protein, TAC [Comamonas kerstersii]QTW20247.1 phage tail assembly chaperone family protein, TAC [Comamonas kerstersii]
MKLSDLQAMGGFVDAEPVKKEASWKLNGQQHTASVFVVRQPFGKVESALGDADKDRSQGAQLISMCIRLGEDASEQLTYEQAYNLHPAVAWAFVGVINEVNTPKH